MKQKTAIFAALLAMFCIAASCGKFDVVGSDSVRAFGEMLNILPAAENGSDWSISAPDGSARFFWNGESAGFAFDAQPFVDAGLDVSVFANEENGLLYIGQDFQSTGRDKISPLEDYRYIVQTSRSAIGYHTALDHYGINLGGGNMFEFAKNIDTNDKDIVFVLNPEPFIAAGIDPDSIQGWVFSKVTVDDDYGKPVQVDKLLKPFDLK